MNRVILKGGVIRDPDIRYGGEDNKTCIARYTLGVNRIKQGESDYINCVCFNKSAEFAEKYLKKGTQILIEGKINSGSYTNKDGVKVYTTDVIVEHHEFCESKKQGEEPQPMPDLMSTGILDIPDDEPDGLPFV